MRCDCGTQGIDIGRDLCGLAFDQDYLKNCLAGIFRQVAKRSTFVRIARDFSRSMIFRSNVSVRVCALSVKFRYEYDARTEWMLMHHGLFVRPVGQAQHSNARILEDDLIVLWIDLYWILSCCWK